MKGAVIKRMVLDASVAVAWCFEDESSDFTEGVLDLLASGTEALAPAIWPLELVNALLMAERRKRNASIPQLVLSCPSHRRPVRRRNPTQPQSHAIR